MTLGIENFIKNDDLDGIVLARAGMERIGRDVNFKYVFGLQEMLPAIGQGQLVAQYLNGRDDVLMYLNSISSFDSSCEFEAERAVVSGLSADCHSSLGVFAKVFQDQIELDAIVLSTDGQSQNKGAS